MAGKFRITIKVFAGFMLLLVAVVISLILINSSLRKHAGMVGKINDPNAFIQTWENTLAELELSGKAMNQYSANNDSTYLIVFETGRAAVNSGLDTLYQLSRSKEGRKAYVDSLAMFVDRRMVLYTTRAFVLVENKNMGSFDNALKKFVAREIDQAKQQPALVAKEKNSALPDNKHKNNFWQRLFNKKKTVEDEEAISANKKTVQPIKKAEIPQVITELRKTEKLVKEESVKHMLSLIADEQNVDNQIYNLTRQMEAAEIRATRNQVMETSAEMEGSAYSVMLTLSIVALVFIIFFTVLIQRDVKRDWQVQKELETARKNAVDLAKARQDFASSMSHEIRTPLNALVGFSEQLAKTQLSADQHKMANALLRSSHHLMSVINPVLDYGKLTAGKAELEITPFDINEVLKDTQLLFEQQANDKNIRLVINLLKSESRVEGDVVKLKQILFNLVSNAIKFTQEGSVTVSCKVLNGDEKKAYRFIVEDSGIGIPPDKINVIFDEFTQADNSITRQFGGTGLGLNIVKRLVELQNGTINVTSAQGQGSCFIFEMPYGAATAVSEDNTKEEFLATALSGKTIMVCDDEEMNRMLLEHILTKFGATIIETDSPKQMLDKIESNHIDLLLLDLHMPGMSGTEALNYIRKHADGRIAKTPVIVVTGDVREDEKQKTIAAGINGYLAKPFVEAQLLRIVLAAFNN